jgi:hypothetical protein
VIAGIEIAYPLDIRSGVMKHILCLRFLIAAFAAVLSTSARATPLLTDAYETQLSAWLGQGSLNFTNIYTKSAGDTAANFHAAVDGQGPTFVLMDIYGNAGFPSYYFADQIVGGFDPQSWSSIEDYNYSWNPSDRTGFIYNLSTDTLQRQFLDGHGLFQTYNSSGYGPTFGGGFDLYTNAALSAGHAANDSYDSGIVGGQPIISGDPNYVPGITGGYEYFNVGALEVYTFAPTSAAVPEASGTLTLLGSALLGLAALRRKFARA